MINCGIPPTFFNSRAFSKSLVIKYPIALRASVCNSNSESYNWIITENPPAFLNSSLLFSTVPRLFIILRAKTLVELSLSLRISTNKWILFPKISFPNPVCEILTNSVQSNFVSSLSDVFFNLSNNFSVVSGLWFSWTREFYY